MLPSIRCDCPPPTHWVDKLHRDYHQHLRPRDRSHRAGSAAGAAAGSWSSHRIAHRMQGVICRRIDNAMEGYGNGDPSGIAEMAAAYAPNGWAKSALRPITKFV